MDSVFRVLKNGDLGDISLGMTKKESRFILGLPDNDYYVSEENSYDKYKSLELRFVNEKIFHIDLHYFNRRIDLPKDLNKKYSTRFKGSYTNLHKFAKTLDKLDISYEVSQKHSTYDEIYLITEINAFARFSVTAGLLNVRVCADDFYRYGE